MIVYNQGVRVELGEHTHAGGEGLICPVINQPNKLAKIYRSQSRTGRETKLHWMLANVPNDPGRLIGHASIAWPENLLYDRSNVFMGYIMPHITNARTLLQVFNPSSRAHASMVCNGYFLHRVARNMAAAVGALHACDYVIGDLNDSNILVTRNALVTVIDTDSFQVREEHDGQLIFYPCPVGRPEYTPPELQGRLLKGEVRQPEQDAFALAVLIFQIMFGGSHPFRVIWKGRGDPPPLEERIYQGWFPYGQAASNPLFEPLSSINLDILYPSLAQLFIRCFVDGHSNPRKRPLPAEWERILTEAEKNLRTCPKNHVYSAHLAECPDCRRGLPPVPLSPPPMVTRPPAAMAGAVPLKAPPPPSPLPVTPRRPNPAPVPAPFPTITFQIKPGMTTFSPFGFPVCINCGNPVPTNVLYCPNCAMPINPKVCKYCGFMKVPDAARCCPKCGKPV